MSKLLNVKIVLPLIALVVITSVTLSVMNKKNKVRPMPGSRELESMDLEILSKNDASWMEQSQALMRLSIQEKPEAMAFIKFKIEANDENLGPWVTRALGYFNSPESFELLRGQLQSNKPGIREAAIDALGIKPHPEKLKLLEEARTFIKDTQSRSRLQLALLRSTSNAAAKTTLAKAVVTDLQSKDLDPNSRRLLINEVFVHSPKTREVETFFKSLTSNIRKADEPSAIAAVRALKIYCPANRFTIFREALSRKDLSLTGQSLILNELIFHPGNEAKKVLKAASGSKGLNPTFLDNLKRQIENPRMKSPCS
ncbi:MAG: HEAT repeat domain-containing protein [Bdellovibrionales bacterium]|nr:HEAT repeat domain-containing protein [Bdellovibrionales bacterium]